MAKKTSLFKYALSFFLRPPRLRFPPSVVFYIQLRRISEMPPKPLDCLKFSLPTSPLSTFVFLPHTPPPHFAAYGCAVNASLRTRRAGCRQRITAIVFAFSNWQALYKFLPPTSAGPNHPASTEPSKFRGPLSPQQIPIHD